METNLIVECPGLREGGKFPVEYTGRGQDSSPEFMIKNLSPEAEALAVTLEDLSHPIKNFTHWVIWNIPAAERIAPAVPAGRTVPSLGGAVQGFGIWAPSLRWPQTAEGENPYLPIYGLRPFSAC